MGPMGPIGPNGSNGPIEPNGPNGQWAQRVQWAQMGRIGPILDDLEVEMLPESNGSTCLNRPKNCFFERFHVFSRFTILVSRGRVGDLIFQCFGDLGDTFSDL